MAVMNQEEVDVRFSEQVYRKPWFEPAPAGDGGDPSMFASPMVLIGIIGCFAFWAVVGWLAFR